MGSGYSRVEGNLHCEDVSLEAIAGAVGTPAYVYSTSVIKERYNALNEALSAELPQDRFRIHFAVKSNSNLAVLSLLKGLGAGVDIVSGGELYRSLKSGYTGADVVFSGVGKTDVEILEALDAGVRMINIESPAELDAIQLLAESRNLVAPVAFRVNPDVTVDSPHPYIKTGEHGMKFGIPDDQIVELARQTLELPNIQLVGLASHMGSQIAQSEPYAITAKKLVGIIDDIKALGIDSIRYIDLGGGIGVTYESEPAMDITAFARAIAPVILATDLHLILEPGRFLVAESGVLVTRVTYRKRSGGKDIIITDAGMNDLIRPALYEAYHAIETVKGVEDHIVADVVGPVCESGDFFALDRSVGNVKSGDLLALRGAGAYGYVMASNYNSRPKPSEVLVDGDRFTVISRREGYEDLIGLESIPHNWKLG